MPFPLLYEINTRCWLNQLSDRHGEPITLATVPEAEFARWGQLGFTHIWLMGVWTTGELSRARALACVKPQHPSRQQTSKTGQPAIGASPYAIADYRVPQALGGQVGLQAFRKKLNRFGIKLVLDFVPNHVGLDHSWVIERPELFVQSLTEAPGTFSQNTSKGIRWLAHGKDPNFPPWSDTVQLDYRLPVTRAAMIETLLAVAAQCDGVRCDMAMLTLNDIFKKTWSGFPVLNPAGNGLSPTGPDSQPRTPGERTPPRQEENLTYTTPNSTASQPRFNDNARHEFWYDAANAVRQVNPDFLFLAEAYWGTERQLVSLGFDYIYDKELYDKLVRPGQPGVQRHLVESQPRSIEAGVHFLENHDEPRIASILALPEHRAAALLILTLPGMRFLYEGQLEGARIKTPVQFLHWPDELPQPGIVHLYEQMLLALKESAVGRGTGRVLRPHEAWTGNPTTQNFVIVQWQAEIENFDLAVVNLAPERSQCYAPLSIRNIANHTWRLKDVLGSEEYTRPGPDLKERGLYLDLPGNGAQLFHFKPADT